MFLKTSWSPKVTPGESTLYSILHRAMPKDVLAFNDSNRGLTQQYFLLRLLSTNVGFER